MSILTVPGPVVTPDDLHAGPGQVLDRGLFGGASELYAAKTTHPCPMAWWTRPLQCQA